MSKRPEEFPEEIQNAFALATKGFFLIPCETQHAAKQIRRILYSLAEAHKKHNTPYTAAAYSIGTSIITTGDARLKHPSYQPELGYPWTLVLWARTRFRDNLAAGQLFDEQPGSINPTHPEFDDEDSGPPPGSDNPLEEIEIDDTVLSAYERLIGGGRSA